MSLKTATQTARERAYQAALRDLARFAELQRQAVEAEAAAMLGAF